MPAAAVIGTGFGVRVHVPALRAAGFEVVALVGRDAERTKRRAERASIPHALTSPADAFAIGSVDAVTIATPPDTHATLAIEACRAGRHVVCEKPFAIDAAEAVQMLEAAEAAGVTHLVGHEFRWAPERALVARAIADGCIGEPRTFSLVSYVSLVADPSVRMPEWWFDEQRGGGWLGASGSHVVDQLRVWLGEIASVSASLPRVSARGGAADDSFVVRVTMRNGAEGVLQQTAASWSPEVCSMTVVAGTEGSLEVAGGRVLLSDRSGKRELAVPDELRLPEPPSVSDDPRERFTHMELGPYTQLCEVLRAGVEGRDPAGGVREPTFADGVAEMRVLDAIKVSARHGGAVVEING